MPLKTEPESKLTKQFYKIGHFRVPKTLTFKMRLGEQSFFNISCGNEFYLHENEKCFPYEKAGFDTETRGNLELASTPTFSQK